MAPRAYWKDYLRLSPVTCPIELFRAVSQSEKTHFHTGCRPARAPASDICLISPGRENSELPRQAGSPTRGASGGNRQASRPNVRQGRPARARSRTAFQFCRRVPRALSTATGSASNAAATGSSGPAAGSRAVGICCNAE